MSTEREGGDIVFVCDGCPETLETGYSTWSYANGVRQEEGWKALPLGTHGARGAEEWTHLCPDCASKRERAKPEDFEDA